MCHWYHCCTSIARVEPLLLRATWLLSCYALNATSHVPLTHILYHCCTVCIMFSSRLTVFMIYIPLAVWLLWWDTYPWLLQCDTDAYLLSIISCHWCMIINMQHWRMTITMWHWRMTITMWHWRMTITMWHWRMTITMWHWCMITQPWPMLFHDIWPDIHNNIMRITTGGAHAFIFVFQQLYPFMPVLPFRTLGQICLMVPRWLWIRLKIIEIEMVIYY
jgi:hypothetical protein